jgi:hypothetical protein
MWSGAKTGLPEKRLAKGTLDREPNAIKRDEIAARQLHALSGYLRQRNRKLRLSDVKELFEQMRDWRHRVYTKSMCLFSGNSRMRLPVAAKMALASAGAAGGTGGSPMPRMAPPLSVARTSINGVL